MSFKVIQDLINDKTKGFSFYKVAKKKWLTTHV